MEGMKVRRTLIPISLQDVGITGSDLNVLSTEAMKVRSSSCLLEVANGITGADLSLLSTEAMKVRFDICLYWRLASQR
jgi:hypothetical protein